MQYGDLSNQVGSAIIINADLLVQLKKKYLGLKTDIIFYLSTRHQLEYWFRDNNLSIYIVCTGEYAKHLKGIENMLDSFITPYTSIVAVETVEDLNELVSMGHVIGYFYGEPTLMNERTGLRKYYQVPNLSEISYLLDGGVRK